jgi:hypothetical protein
LQWWSPNAPVWMLYTQGRGTPTSRLETNPLLRRSFDQIPNPVRLNSSFFARSQQFRVQFVGAARGREPLLLKEVGIEAADVSAAVVAAASLALPPKTNGLHILDREGRVVFARERTNPRLQSLSRLEPQVAVSGLRPRGLSQWRRALKTKHLYLSYVHNVQTRRREQAVQHHAGWNKLGDKLSGSQFALVGQALRAFETMKHWRRSPRAQNAEALQTPPPCEDHHKGRSAQMTKGQAKAQAA